MHILISALSRFTHPTGICRHAANLARCFDDYSPIEKITFVLGRWQEDYFRRFLDLDSPKVEVITVDIPNTSLSRNRWFASGLPRLANAGRPDLVHLSFPVPVFRSRFRSPLTVTVHDMYAHDFPETFGAFNAFWKRRFFGRCMQACDGVACVSQTTLNSLQRRFPRLSSRVPVRLVHNYADFSPRLPQTPPMDPDPRPFILTVAQHQRNKRLDLLLRAFRRLLPETGAKPLRLLVVGSSGSETEGLHALTRSLKLEDCVRWLPPISNVQLAWLYQNCEVFVASSCIEGFCLPLVEAMSFSCPTVVSDISVFRELAGENAIFFGLSSAPVENLANAIQQALKLDCRPHPPRVRFSRQSTAAECLSLYSLVLSRELLPAQPAEGLAVTRAGIAGNG